MQGFRFRREDSQGLFIVAQFFLVFAGIKGESLAVWRGVAVAIAVIALFGWLSALRRVRAVTDTPTSRIESAAQGYVELQGRGQALEGLPVVARLTSTVCLWYRYRIEVRRDDKWETEESGESDDSFILDDGTGIAVVNPAGAEILPARKRSWSEGNRRFTEWLMLPRDPIYVLGGFRTRGGDALALDENRDVSLLIALWKEDRPRLLTRFDLDDNGELDMKEWALVRAQALREVSQEHAALRAQPGVNLVEAPAGDRPYLISALPTEKIILRFRIWIGVHLAIFFAALAGFAKASGWF